MTNPNDPAFITVLEKVAHFPDMETKDWFLPHGGLTKREYFAAMAIQAIAKPFIEIELDGSLKIEHDGIAANAVAVADALIEELSK